MTTPASATADGPVLARLIPLHPVSNEPISDASFPAIDLSRGHIHLGNNDVTGINDSTFSHREAKVYHKGQRIYVFCNKAKKGNKVVLRRHKNNYNAAVVVLEQTQRCEVFHWDCIGLSKHNDNSDNENNKNAVQYQYRVELYVGQQAVNAAPPAAYMHTADTGAITIPDDDDNSNNVAPAAAAASSRLSLPQLASEMECPVCYEVLVNPATVIPCGHTFCAACLDQKSQNNHKHCSVCRGPINGRVKAIGFENLIDTLVQAAAYKLPENIEILDREDMDTYLQRKGHPRKPDPTTSCAPPAGTARPPKQRRTRRAMIGPRTVSQGNGASTGEVICID